MKIGSFELIDLVRPGRGHEILAPKALLFCSLRERKVIVAVKIVRLWGSTILLFIDVINSMSKSSLGKGVVFGLHFYITAH